jgi:hypothetical protein
MIEILKSNGEVIVNLPMKILNFDLHVFNSISDEIYFIKTLSPDSNKIVREKGSIEEMNMSHWLCLKNRYQAIYNDPNLKSLDVNHLIKLNII